MRANGFAYFSFIRFRIHLRVIRRRAIMYYESVCGIIIAGSLEVVDMPRKRLLVNLNDAVRRYRRGEGLKSIAHDLGVGEHRLRQDFLNEGVEIRNRSAAGKVVWEMMSPNQKRKQVLAAHKSVRGKEKTPGQKHRAALGRAKRLQETQAFVGRYEGLLKVMLESRGFKPVSQQAVGGYNLDLGIAPVAVEIHVATNNPLSEGRYRKRAKYLARRNWFTVYVWITAAHPFGEHAADKIVSLLYAIKRNPSSVRKNIVIRGSGEDVF